MKKEKQERKQYSKPAIIQELNLETRAGTPLGPIPGPLDLPGSGDDTLGS